MHAVQRFVRHEPLECFDPEGELSRCERPFVPETSLAKSFEVLCGRVFGAVDDAEVLRAAALDAGLHHPSIATDDRLGWFDDHAFASNRGELGPPRHASGNAVGVVEINRAAFRMSKHPRAGCDQAVDDVEVPGVGPKRPDVKRESAEEDGSAKGAALSELLHDASGARRRTLSGVICRVGTPSSSSRIEITACGGCHGVAGYFAERMAESASVSQRPRQVPHQGHRVPDLPEADR